MTTRTALAAEDIEALEPTFLGPTWRTDPSGQWKLPKRTLGWQIAGWAAGYLKAENGGP